MSPRLALILCISLLLAAFAFDMLTPQALVAAILLTIPVALSSLVLDRRITQSVIIVALIANVVAGYYNGVREGYTWNTIAIANRALAAFSIVLVGLLGGMAQAAAERNGQLLARQRQLQREHALRRSMETIRSSLNLELVARSVVREAVKVFEIPSARLYTIENNMLAATTYSRTGSYEDVEVTTTRPQAELLSLLQLALSERRIIKVSPADALGRFALATLAAGSALVVALVDDQTAFGILVLSSDDPQAFSVDVEHWVQAFAEQATVAAVQASLFVELGNRNAELQSAIATVTHKGEVIRDLVYALSHDLRTPLAAAAMTLQQALDGSYGALPESYREVLRRSVAANEELRRLAETLLLVARYESGDQSTVREPVDLQQLLTGVVQELQPLWQVKHIATTVSSAQGLTVLADAGELRRATMNLLANAISWTPESGSIHVSAEQSADRVIVQIADSGYGISESQERKLFQRLNPQEPARQGAGSGLGLYIVRRIIESHGGSVRYERNVPSGSVFIVDLPAYISEPVRATSAVRSEHR